MITPVWNYGWTQVAENGVEYDPNSNTRPNSMEPIRCARSCLSFGRQRFFRYYLKRSDVAEWRDKSGNGYDMVAQGHPKLAEYGYDPNSK